MWRWPRPLEGRQAPPTSSSTALMRTTSDWGTLSTCAPTSSSLTLHASTRCGPTQSEFDYYSHKQAHPLRSRNNCKPVPLSSPPPPPCSGDPWFCGPWFIRPAETQHAPTKLFREKELFMSNIQDTNPMYSIIGKCAVLLCSDYCRSESARVISDF